MLKKATLLKIQNIFAKVYPNEEILLVRNFTSENAWITHIGIQEGDKVVLDIKKLTSLKLSLGGLLLHNHNNGDVCPSPNDIATMNTPLLLKNKYIMGIFAYKNGCYVNHAIRTATQYHFKYRRFIHGIDDHLTFVIDILRGNKNKKNLKDFPREFSESSRLDISNFIMHNKLLRSGKLPKNYDLVCFDKHKHIGVIFRGKLMYVPKHSNKISNQTLPIKILSYNEMLNTIKNPAIYEVK